MNFARRQILGVNYKLEYPNFPEILIFSMDNIVSRQSRVTSRVPQVVCRRPRVAGRMSPVACSRSRAMGFPPKMKRSALYTEVRFHCMQDSNTVP